MAVSAHSSRTPFERLESLSRKIVLAAAAAIAAASMLIGAPAASAIVTEVDGNHVGVQPVNSSTALDGLLGLSETYKLFENPNPETFADDPAEPLAPGPVVHGSQLLAIYWDPEDYYHGDWQGVIDGFLQKVGGESNGFGDVFAVDEQYTDKSDLPAYNRETFHGAYTDTDPYPYPNGCTDPNPLHEWKAHKTKAIGCLSAQQIQTELGRFIAAHELPRGMNTIYYLMTPPGVTVCLDSGGASGHCSDFAHTLEERKEVLFNKAKREVDTYESESYRHSFCSYHSDINPDGALEGDGSTILYGVIPWTAGGVGDGQLAPTNGESEAVYCQDGGFNPQSKPIEEKEGRPELTEQTKYESLPLEGKEEFLTAHESDGPHVQEPSQVSCPSSDGFCDTGLADLIINQIAVQQQDIVTDPLLNAWQDDAGNEVSNECSNFFAPAAHGGAGAEPESGAGTLYNQMIGEHPYYLQTAFNMAALRLNYPGIDCLPGVRLEPQFTDPNPVKGETEGAKGEEVAFDGMESDITLNAATDFTSTGTPQSTYATYTWNFGDSPWDETPEVSGYAPGAPVCEAPWVNPEPPAYRKPPGKWIGCAASVFHSFKYGGSYNVTLTVSDVAGNSASVTHTVTVIGKSPPPTVTAIEPGSGSTAGGTVVTIHGTDFVAPASVTIERAASAVTVDSPTEITATTPAAVAGTYEVVVADADGTSAHGPSYTYVEPPASSSKSGTTGGSSGSSGSSGPGGAEAMPVAKAAILSRTLRSVTSKGLVVHYSVNEEVTGHFDVLLATSIAKRIGLHGPRATGLPAGTPSETVIGKAVLVASKGGQSTVVIQLAKKTTADLRKLHKKVSVMLQLVVRNANSQTTTVLSVVTLSR